MKKILAVAVATLPVLSSVGTASAADVISRRDSVPTYTESDQRGGVRIGYLDCSIGGGVGYVLGSAKEADCVFTSTIGSEPLDRYTGVVRKMGVDIGFTTRSRMIWAVLAPTAAIITVRFPVSTRAPAQRLRLQPVPASTCWSVAPPVRSTCRPSA